MEPPLLMMVGSSLLSGVVGFGMLMPSNRC